MPHETREVRPFSKPRHVVTNAGAVLAVPAGWSLLPPGDAALSRRIKQDGPSWTVVELKGRKRFSRGIWAPTDRIETLRAELEIERRNPAYEKRLAAGRRRRDQEQAAYAGEFEQAVLAFLAFHSRYDTEAHALARLISDHAVPVGSGTVARTERIPVEQRAEAATIAWLRHQTTGYDDMVIPRVKGRRREVRRLLAERSRSLLEKYRRGQPTDPANCPLRRALKLSVPAPTTPVQTSLPLM
ncbi:DUF2293 domain-containing protein [Opitutaceae bacterium EW11]|nr:DUF2293 domain-containing protein [Opitutaceae bacterium EW11]